MVEFLKSGKTFGNLFYLLLLSCSVQGGRRHHSGRPGRLPGGTGLATVARFSPPVSMCCLEVTKPSMDLGKEGLYSQGLLQDWGREC